MQSYVSMPLKHWLWGSLIRGILFSMKPSTNMLTAILQMEKLQLFIIVYNCSVKYNQVIPLLLITALSYTVNLKFIV